MDQQNQRSEAIKKKVQERVDAIRKKEEEQCKRREKVRLYHSSLLEQERKSIEPRLNDCYNKLFSYEDKSKQHHQSKAINPKSRNAMI